MDTLSEWWDALWRLASDTKGKLMASVLLLFLLRLLNRLAIRSIPKVQQDLSTRYAWRKTTMYVTYLLSIVGLAMLWANKFDSFATFLGLLSAGLAIAFRDLIMNLAGWYFIIVEKPFKVGDRIQIGEHAGDVVDTRLLQFTLIEIGGWVDADQSTGRILHIPNSRIFTTSVANYNRGINFIWNEVPVLLTFESDWRKAKELFLKVLEEHTPKIKPENKRDLFNSDGKFYIVFNKLTPIVYTNVKASGVELTLRHLCNPKNRRGSLQNIWEAVLAITEQHEDINLAYPTQRIVYEAPDKKDKE